MIPAQESSRSSVLSAGEGMGRHYLAIAPGLDRDGQEVYFDGLLAVSGTVSRRVREKTGSSAESVGGFSRIAPRRLDFLRHGSGVQWG